MQRADRPALFVSAKRGLAAEQSATLPAGSSPPPGGHTPTTDSTVLRCWLALFLQICLQLLSAFLSLAGSQDGQPRSITRRS